MIYFSKLYSEANGEFDGRDGTRLHLVRDLVDQNWCGINTGDNVNEQLGAVCGLYKLGGERLHDLYRDSNVLSKGLLRDSIFTHCL